MVIKSYSKGNVEILVTRNESGPYQGMFNVVKLVGGNKSNGHFNETYENVDDIFDYWVEGETEQTENDCE